MILQQIECPGHSPEFGEGEFYFQMPINDKIKTVAAVSMYSQPDPFLRTLSYDTLLSCTKLGNDGVKIVDVKDITAVVAMVPHRPVIPGNVTGDRFFFV